MNNKCINYNWSAIIFTPREFFTPALRGGFSLKSERQKVSSALQDSPQYSIWSLQSCGFDGLDSSPGLQFPQSLFQTFGDCSKCANHNWYHHHLHVSQLFQLTQDPCPLSWGCRIYPLQRGKTPLTSVLDMILKIWGRGSSNAGALENTEYSFIAIALRSTLIQSGSTWQGPIYGSNRSKLRTYAKLNCLKWKCFDI